MSNEKRTVEMGYIDDKVNLEPRMVQETLEAYENGAVSYTNDLSFQPDYITVVWKQVLSPLFNIMKTFGDEKRGKILFAGDGPLRDSITTLLLSKYLDVFAFDASQNMLDQGRARLNWGTILLVSTLIYDQDKSSVELANGKSLIQGIIHIMQAEMGEKTPTLSPEDELAIAHISPEKMIKIERGGKEEEIPLKAFLKIANAPFSAAFKKRVVDGVNERLITKKGLLQEKVFGNQQFDLIFAIATLQHLEKASNENFDEHTSDLDLALDNLITSLEVGGVLYFNVRLDIEPIRLPNQLTKGRVYVDNILGENLFRYYATLSISEVEALQQRLIRRHPNIEFLISNNRSGHPEPKKPEFYNFFITKKR